MVIGKPEWFARRKYTGWGITPKTWQGWLYIALVIIPFAVFQSLPYWDIKIRMIVTVIWVLFLMIDVFDIMIRMKKDERDKIHEAISERNALWAIMIVIVIGILYQIITSAIDQNMTKIDWFLLIALFAGVIVKSISNFYLDKMN
jgi:hypothetical protein